MARKLKVCPKCGGKMMPDRDEYGAYEQCIQCGYLMDLKLSATQDENMFDKVMARQ
jgi:DNA-directed RNA polymerase subunit M/transcription elongation factor TFIIS